MQSQSRSPPPQPPPTPLKILCMSDTHGQTPSIDLSHQSGDIFIHCGDFTIYSRDQNINQFVGYLDKLKFRYKVVICGNHEISFDKNVGEKIRQKRKHTISERSPDELIKLLKKHCIYLEHEFVEIEGVRIFGSPYINKHGSTAFSYKPELAEKIWENLPKELDILVTHGPPFGINDIGKQQGKHVGCPALLQKVKQIQPKYHLFGHIHESGGRVVKAGNTVFANVSQCGPKRQILFKPFKFEIVINRKNEGVMEEKIDPNGSAEEKQK